MCNFELFGARVKRTDYDSVTTGLIELLDSAVHVKLNGLWSVELSCGELVSCDQHFFMNLICLYLCCLLSCFSGGKEDLPGVCRCALFVYGDQSWVGIAGREIWKVKYLDQVDELLNFKESKRGVIMVLQNIVFPRDSSDECFNEKNRCPGAVDF